MRRRRRPDNVEKLYTGHVLKLGNAHRIKDMDGLA